ncbi:MAG: ribulose-phosphate 3-epimerase [Bdellovibrio sp.]|nr:ribulose-phosphate 3-epimerase [Bdellovibrio sp.]
MSKALIAPSVLSADFACLGDEIKSVEAGGADWIHVDVMDGHFVPNLTLGPVIVQSIRPVTRLPLDCHLMVSEPEKWVEPFAKAGADVITVHAEATPHLDRLLRQIRELGCKAGVSLNPASSVSLIEEVLDLVDLVLVMSVNPGFGGQKFIESTVAKVEKLVQLQKKHSFLVEIDGGVSVKNIGILARAGVNVFVAGSSVFSAKDRAKAIQDLRAEILREARR